MSSGEKKTSGITKSSGDKKDIWWQKDTSRAILRRQLVVILRANRFGGEKTSGVKISSGYKNTQDIKKSSSRIRTSSAKKISCGKNSFKVIDINK